MTGDLPTVVCLSFYRGEVHDGFKQVLVGGCGLNQFNDVNGFCNLGYWVRQSWQPRGPSWVPEAWGPRISAG